MSLLGCCNLFPMEQNETLPNIPPSPPKIQEPLSQEAGRNSV